MAKPSKSSSRPRAPLARYANYFEIGHNACEFLLDFAQYQPESARVVLHTRIALGPVHAKLLAGMLDRAIERHEAEHGAIADAGGPIDPLDVVLQSLPDFERRAVDARRDGANGPPVSAGRRSTLKR
jgi:hypothetical protein